MGVSYEMLAKEVDEAKSSFKELIGTTRNRDEVLSVASELTVDRYAYRKWRMEEHSSSEIYKSQFGDGALAKVYNATIQCFTEEYLERNVSSQLFATQEQRITASQYAHSRWTNSLIFSLFRMCTILLWSDTKKVFRFDGDFLDALVNTENVFIPPNALAHLPFPDMYFDFSANSEFCKKIECDGVFVSTRQTVSVCTEESIRELWELSVAPNNGGCHLVTLTENQEVKNEDITALVMQCLIYLSSTDPDTRRVPKAKKPKNKIANSPAARLENKSSIVEVGFRYGEAYRAHMQKLKSKEETASKQTSGSRKSPKPHVVRAHYNYYWCGKGRTELRPRWLSPYYVGVKDQSEEIDTVAHNIIGEDKVDE